MLARVLEAVEWHDGFSELDRRASDHDRLGLRLFRDRGHTVEADVVSRLVDVVAHVVESTGKAVNVVAVERRDKRSVEEVDDVLREAVALVFGPS